MTRNAGAPRREWWRKGRPGRLKSSMAGLSAAAILAVYAAGYVSSDAAAHEGAVESLPPKAALAAATATPVTPSPTAGRAGVAPTATPRAGTASGSTPTRPAAPSPTPTKAPAQTAVRYTDGTYTGSGTGRHGGMTVEVQVQGGKIVAVDITQCGTRYPCDRIATLPERVVEAQSPNVSYVSRATDSSVAFMRAVQAALAKAAV